MKSDDSGQYDITNPAIDAPNVKIWRAVPCAGSSGALETRCFPLTPKATQYTTSTGNQAMRSYLFNIVDEFHWKTNNADLVAVDDRLTCSRLCTHKKKSSVYTSKQAQLGRSHLPVSHLWTCPSLEDLIFRGESYLTYSICIVVLTSIFIKYYTAWYCI